jgi:hypothetical protein
MPNVTTAERWIGPARAGRFDEMAATRSSGALGRDAAETPTRLTIALPVGAAR